MDYRFKVQRIRPSKGKARVVKSQNLRDAASAASKLIRYINYAPTWERLIALEPGDNIVVEVPMTFTSYQITRLKKEE